MPKTDEHPAATAADILARGPEAPSIDPRWQKYFDRLNRLREYIAQQRSTQIANAHTGEPVFGVRLITLRGKFEMPPETTAHHSGVHNPV